MTRESGFKCTKCRKKIKQRYSVYDANRCLCKACFRKGWRIDKYGEFSQELKKAATNG